MQYGYFDDPNREYIITDPRTPTKWINYIGTIEFGGFVDQTGGALLCAGDPALNRILKYIPQVPSSQPNGATLYLRTHDGDGYKLLSPFFVPTLDPYESYTCHVGLGYQKIVTVTKGIRTEVLIFIPIGTPVEIRQITVTNERDQPVSLDVIPVVEYSHFEALKQFTNADWVPQTMISDADWEESGEMILRQYPFMRRDTVHNFMASNHPVDSFESDRGRFLGNNEYANWQDPEALKSESLSNYAARRGNNIGALLHKLGSLQPGESKQVVVQLGHAPKDDVAQIVERFRDPENVDAAFKDLRASWSTNLSKFSCQTPDAAFNSMVNVHNPRQCYITMNWSRFLSLYQLGLGARGIGFRDSSQDSLGAVMGAPEEVRALLSKLLSVQNPDGSAMHQFFPLTMEANRGDSREKGEDLIYGDDHLWVVLAVCGYIKETGDYTFLEEEITFYAEELPLDKREKAPVLEHLMRAVRFTKEHVGQHGLPLAGFADWNDTVNLDGAAESLFNAFLYGCGLNELSELLDHLNQDERSSQLRADYAEMKARVNEHAWDGEWYVRYFTEDGEPMGSNKNSHGKIWTNAQSWAVMSGFADQERGKTALASVSRLLNTENGIKLNWPGFNGYDTKFGGVSTYPPGAKENGGIFLHSNPWVMIAETLQGNGDQAFKYYQAINPATKNDKIDTYEIEPYVYAQNILGDEHPQFGLGRNSWLSGTASWTFQAATQFILGIQPKHNGLKIVPCIPSSWGEYSIERTFRESTYRISLSNPYNISKGRVEIVLDGEKIDGDIVPLQSAGSVHKVEVTLLPLSTAAKDQLHQNTQAL